MPVPQATVEEPTWHTRESCTERGKVATYTHEGAHMVASMTGGLVGVGDRILADGPLDAAAIRRLEAVFGLDGVAVLQTQGETVEIFANGSAVAVVQTEAGAYLWRDGRLTATHTASEMLRAVLVSGAAAVFLSQEQLLSLAESRKAHVSIELVKGLGDEYAVATVDLGGQDWTFEDALDQLPHATPSGDADLKDTEPRGLTYMDLHATTDTEPIGLPKPQPETAHLWDTEPNSVPDEAAAVASTPVPPTPPMPQDAAPWHDPRIVVSLTAAVSAFTAASALYLLV